jgi:UDP-N-acetylenolpyruvoylglucosamine reductase
VWVEPCCEEDLANLLRFCNSEAVPWFVIGRGSNLLIKDRGFRGVVVCLNHESFSRAQMVPGGRLECGAGAKLRQVAILARDSGIAGLEFLEGIPGTVGGALRMNAGAMGGAIFERVEMVRLIDHAGVLRESGPSELKPHYRSCDSLSNAVVVAALLRGEPGDPGRIHEAMERFSQRRWQSQPAAPSAGCIFKNPTGYPAGKLIDELGLKGTRVGGAMVSMEHGNFFINTGGATASDFLDLIDLVRKKAQRERGIELQTEVQLIGD